MLKVLTILVWANSFCPLLWRKDAARGVSLLSHHMHVHGIAIPVGDTQSIRVPEESTNNIQYQDWRYRTVYTVSAPILPARQGSRHAMTPESGTNL